MSIYTPVICLIACHGGPADHFATYADSLTKQGYEVHIHATGPALGKFQERGNEVKYPFLLDQLSPDGEKKLAESIAKTCSTATCIISDVGHAFDIKIQEALSQFAPKVSRYAYYDNAEPFVPGGYSTVAAEVIRIADGVLFANETLACSTVYNGSKEPIDFGSKRRIGIGYYPIKLALDMAKRRDQLHTKMRASFLENNNLKDTSQNLWVYFGGNNDEYFNKALPAFLSLLSTASNEVDLGNTIIVLQQHPGAKPKNLDGQLVAKWQFDNKDNVKSPKIIISSFSSNDAQVLAQSAFYYQTSMGPQFVLAGIPTVQIGHETYEDILVKGKLAPSVTNTDQFVSVIKTLNTPITQPPQKEMILKGLGINDHWEEKLEDAILETIPAL